MTQCPLDKVETIIKEWRTLESIVTFDKFGIEASHVNSTTLLKFKDVITKTSMLEKPSKPVRNRFYYPVLIL